MSSPTSSPSLSSQPVAPVAQVAKPAQPSQVAQSAQLAQSTQPAQPAAKILASQIAASAPIVATPVGLKPKVLPLPGSAPSPAPLQRQPSIQLFTVPSVYTSPPPYLSPAVPAMSGISPVPASNISAVSAVSAMPVAPVAPAVPGVSPVPAVSPMPAVSPVPAMPGLYSVPLPMASRYSLNHIPSETALRDPGYQSSLLSRESLAYPDAYRWDPAMSQLHRAPDSVKTINVGVYSANATQPVVLPLRRSGSSTSQELLRKPSLLSQISGERGLSDEVRQDSINLWGVATPVELKLAPRTELQSEVCFDESDGEAPAAELKRGVSGGSVSGAPFVGGDSLQSLNASYSLDSRGYSATSGTL